MIVGFLVLVSSGAFAYYGSKCLFSESAKREYIRWGIPQLRILNGLLQFCGAGGLLVGLAFAPLGAAAATGLFVMMMLGLLTRYRLHDTYGLWIPATTLAVLNGVIAVLFAVRI